MDDAWAINGLLSDTGKGKRKTGRAGREISESAGEAERPRDEVKTERLDES